MMFQIMDAGEKMKPSSNVETGTDDYEPDKEEKEISPQLPPFLPFPSLSLSLSLFLSLLFKLQIG